MPRIVKSFLWIFNIFLIIFLTGCAAQRYHTSTVQGTGSTASAGTSFGWPLDGRLIFPFGSREDGVTLKGVVIEGSEGQEVRAAADGKVVYADDSMRGYGKTLIVEHVSGYSTVYARNSEILARVGDSVRRSQTIARIGRAGKGALPQVYFELRRYSKALDPGTVLK